MEEFYDKLKFLDYENIFLKIKFTNYSFYKGNHPLHKLFFAIHLKKTRPILVFHDS